MMIYFFIQKNVNYLIYRGLREMDTENKESDWRDINSIDESDDSDTEYIIRRRSKKRKIHRKTTHKKKMRRIENKFETTSSLEETD